MRKIVVAEFVSLDGVMQAPGGAEEDTEGGFAQGGWKVYLNTPEDIVRCIGYVEDNPRKEGKPRQRWTFVRPFTGRV